MSYHTYAHLRTPTTLYQNYMVRVHAQSPICTNCIWVAPCASLTDTIHQILSTPVPMNSGNLLFQFERSQSAANHNADTLCQFNYDFIMATAAHQILKYLLDPNSDKLIFFNLYYHFIRIGLTYHKYSPKVHHSLYYQFQRNYENVTSNCT